jgi:transposase InsO family protein
MSRKGNPYDNAYAESLVKTLKSEEVSLGMPSYGRCPGEDSLFHRGCV